MALDCSLPASFRDSYLGRDSYPMNVIDRTISTYPSALSEYLRRLNNAANDLCEPEISKIDVPFRDLQVRSADGGWKGSFKGPTKTNLQELMSYIRSRQAEHTLPTRPRGLAWGQDHPPVRREEADSHRHKTRPKVPLHVRNPSI